MHAFKPLATMLLALFGTALIAQTTIASQSFEGSGWSFTESPNTYEVGDDIWAQKASGTQGLNATDGANYWFMRDLNNSNGGGSQKHTLTFTAQDVSSYLNVALSFDYHVFEFDTGDDIFYEVFEDGISQGEVKLVDGASNLTASGTETINITPGTGNVYIVLKATQNGGGDYGFFDNVILEGTLSGGGGSPSNIAQQGFEGSGWSFAESPTTYEVGSDIWAQKASGTQSLNATEGSNYWFMQDLDNPNGGGSQKHTLTFTAQDVSAFTNVTLSFDYHVFEFDSGDDVFYEVFEDGASQGEVKLVDGSSNLTVSGTETINITPGTNSVYIVLKATQNGGGDYGFFDNVVLAGVPAMAGPISPQGFEGSGWNFRSNPATYESGSDIWATKASGTNGLNAPEGSNYWFMQDLDNPNGGGAFKHELGFDTVSVAGLFNVEISFVYQVFEWDNGDNLYYEVIEDGVSQGEMQFFTGGGDKSDSARMTISVTPGTSQLGFFLRAEQNGGGDYGYFDDIGINATASAVKPEPSNHVMAFAAQAAGDTSIDLSWMDNNGTQAADSFLIVGQSAMASAAIPVDGTPVANDLDWSDDLFAINVAAGVEQYTVGGLNATTSYTFFIYPYTNSGSDIDFKTNPAAPQALDTTFGPGVTLAQQGFEGSGWSFTATPNAYDQNGDIWSPKASGTGSLNAPEGSNFWFMQDLDNSVGGGSFQHILEFSPQNVSGFVNPRIAFDYEVSGWDNGDDLFYELFEDGISQGEVQFLDGFSNLDASGTIVVNITPGTVNVYIQIKAEQNGGSDNGFIDNVRLLANQPGPQTIAAQSFEGSGWNFTPNPASYAVSDDNWTAAVDGSGGLTATDGANFWFMEDLENGNGGGAFKHLLTFDPQNIAGFSNVSLSFDYQVNGYDNGDDLFYELFEDGISQGEVKFVDGFSNLDDNGTINLPITPGTNSVYIILKAEQNGGDQGMFDNVRLVGTPSGVAPEPSNHVASFLAQEDGADRMDLSWMDNDGATAAQGFLILGKTATNSFTAPVDGTPVADDLDWSDGLFAVNVFPGQEAYKVMGLAPETEYEFLIYPYTNSGSAIDYKTGGTVPGSKDTTTETPVILAQQSFEGSGWAFSPTPAPYDQSGDVWGVKPSNTGGLQATDGPNFWFMTDLENGNGGGAFKHVLEFVPQNVAAYSDVEVAFDFATDGYDNTDYLFYEIFEDGVGQGEDTLVDGGENGSVQGTEVISINPGVSTVYIEIRARQNGSDDAMVDNVRLSGILSNPKAEPTNHVASFAGNAPSFRQVDLTWNDNDGTVAADGFLVVGSTGAGVPVVPVDGTPVADDLDWSDGAVAVNVGSGTQALSFLDRMGNTAYNFSIYPYSNPGGSAIDYKTDGTVPTANVVTPAAPPVPTLIITEVADPADNFQGRFVEIYNYGMSPVDLDASQVHFVREANGSSIASVALSGNVPAGGVVTVAASSTHSGVYGFPADFDFFGVTGNGDDGYYLYDLGDETSGRLFDAYGVPGQDGTGQAWAYEDQRALRNDPRNTTPNATWTASEWTISGANVSDCTPGALENEYRYTGVWRPRGPEGNATVADDLLVLANGGSSNGNTQARNLSIGQGLSYQIQSGDEIALDGVLQNWGVGLTGTGTLKFTGNGQLMGNALRTVGTVMVEGGASLNTNDSLILNATGPATYGQLAGNGTVNGNVTSQIYLDLAPTIPNRRPYLLGAPVKDQQIADFDGDAGIGRFDVEKIKNSGRLKPVSTVNQPIARGEAYIFNAGSDGSTASIRTQSGVLSFTGPVDFSDVSVGLSFSTRITFAGLPEGMNAVANPYTAQYDWDQQVLPSHVAPAIAIINDNTGGFAYYNPVTGVSLNGGSRYLAVGQGFVIQNLSAVPGQTFTFNASNRVTAPSTPLLKKAPDALRLTLQGADAQQRDEALIGFDPQARLEFDREMDALKVPNPGNLPNLAIAAPQGPYAIAMLPNGPEDREVGLALSAAENGAQMQISADASDLRSYAAVYLIDRKLGREIDLKQEDYAFAHDAHYPGQRFALRFGKDAQESGKAAAKWYAYRDANALYLRLPAANAPYQVEIYNLNGQRLAAFRTSEAEVEILSEAPSGVYLLRVNGETQRVLR